MDDCNSTMVNEVWCITGFWRVLFITVESLVSPASSRLQVLIIDSVSTSVNLQTLNSLGNWNYGKGMSSIELGPGVPELPADPAPEGSALRFGGFRWSLLDLLIPMSEFLCRLVECSSCSDTYHLASGTHEHLLSTLSISLCSYNSPRE